MKYFSRSLSLSSIPINSVFPFEFSPYATYHPKKNTRLPQSHVWMEFASSEITDTRASHTEHFTRWSGGSRGWLWLHQSWFSAENSITLTLVCQDKLRREAWSTPPLIAWEHGEKLSRQQQRMESSHSKSIKSHIIRHMRYVECIYYSESRVWGEGEKNEEKIIYTLLSTVDSHASKSDGSLPSLAFFYLSSQE